VDVTVRGLFTTTVMANQFYGCVFKIKYILLIAIGVPSLDEGRFCRKERKGWCHFVIFGKITLTQLQALATQ
jgi:hypothetical protein